MLTCVCARTCLCVCVSETENGLVCVVCLLLAHFHTSSEFVSDWRRNGGRGEETTALSVLNPDITISTELNTDVTINTDKHKAKHVI